MQASIRVAWHPRPLTITTRRGTNRRYTPAFAAAMDEWERLCRAEGVPFTETQGGFSNGVAASAGTHGGDSTDLRTRGLTDKQIARMIELGRMVGIAAWFRTTSKARLGTRAQGFATEHVHGVPNLWGFLSPSAANQARSYRQGRDGLARNLADLGPGHTAAFRTQTWQSYLTTKPGLPSSGANNAPTVGGLTVTDVTRIMESLAIIQHNTAAAFGPLGGREHITEQARATVAFPIQRTAGPSPLISEVAAIKDDTTGLRAQVAAPTAAVSQLASGKVDTKAIEAAARKGADDSNKQLRIDMATQFEALEMTLRGVIVEAQGDIDAEQAGAFADAVLDRLAQKIGA